MGRRCKCWNDEVVLGWRRRRRRWYGVKWDGGIERCEETDWMATRVPRKEGVLASEMRMGRRREEREEVMVREWDDWLKLRCCTAVQLVQLGWSARDHPHSIPEWPVSWTESEETGPEVWLNEGSKRLELDARECWNSAVSCSVMPRSRVARALCRSLYSSGVSIMLFSLVRL